jgi:hypothetical protein
LNASAADYFWQRKSPQTERSQRLTILKYFLQRSPRPGSTKRQRILTASAVSHLNTFGKEEVLCLVAPKDKEYLNANAVNHLNTFSKEEVLCQVAPKGGKAARLVQRVPAHESGHPCGAIHAQKVGRQVDTRVARTKVYLGSNQVLIIDKVIK